MRIVIDLTSLSYHLTGIERYAMCVSEKMLELDKDNSYVLIFRNDIPALYTKYIDGERVVAEVIRGEKKLLFLQWTLYRKLKSIKADKYLFFAFPSPYLFKRKGIINTIHDMGAWDSSSEMQKMSNKYFKISYKKAAKISEYIITVSKFSKGRIADILHVANERIKVIPSAVYEGITENIAPFEDIQKSYDVPSKYIMTLSTIEPRKNMRILLEAYTNIADKVDYDLLLVGRKGWNMDDTLSVYENNPRIHITGFVKDEHLSAVYKNALCFVFPSLYEGFGLPPVESLALGTPVISSDAASLPEVLMEQARY